MSERRISHHVTPIPAQLVHLHWSSGHDFRLSRVTSRQARETRVRFPDGELHFLFFRVEQAHINLIQWMQIGFFALS